MRCAPPCLLVIALAASTAGCQFMTGVVPCRHGEHCPTGETCDAHLGVCTPSAGDGVEQQATSSEGEGEGDAHLVGGEGEGAPSEGEGGGGVPSGGEGEGEGGTSGGGEGEGGVAGGEGEGEGGFTLFVCGNGAVEPGEACDDGNRVSGDGCSSTCSNEQAFNETEPDDFPDDPGVQHLPAPEGVIRGNLTAATVNGPDVDGYFFSEPTGTVARVQVFTAPGNACDGSSISMALFVGPLGDTLLRTAENNAIGGCPELLTVFDHPELSFALLETTGASVPSYTVEIKRLDDRGPETEPNDDILTAEVAAVDGLDATMSGSIGRADDVDMYAVVVPPGAGLRAEAAPASSATGCDAFNATLALLDDTGAQLVARGSADGACAFVDGTSASPRDAVAHNGTTDDAVFYVAIAKGSSGFAGALPYKLALTVR